MNDQSLVSIVIPNYNGRHLLDDCLSSLLNQKYPKIEIILVDNGSSDNSVSYVKNNFPQVKILPLGHNFGFAAGCNAGIRVASGKYLLVINNDTWSSPDLIDELVNTMESNLQIGMVAPKILNFFNRKEIDSIGVGIFFDGTSKGNLRFKIDNGSFDISHEILCPSGCAAFYKMEMFNDIGLFDEDFFAYCEDTDLGLRGQLAGWKGYYNPKAIVYHKYSGTAKPFSDKKVYCVERNRIWLLFKNFPFFLIFLSPFFTFFRYSIGFITAFKSEGSVSNYIKNYSAKRLVFTIIKSHIDALLSLKNTLEKRNIINRKKRIRTSVFLRLLWKNKINLETIMLQ